MTTDIDDMDADDKWIYDATTGGFVVNPNWVGCPWLAGARNEGRGSWVKRWQWRPVGAFCTARSLYRR